MEIIVSVIGVTIKRIRSRKIVAGLIRESGGWQWGLDRGIETGVEGGGGG
jgi:hypothetical protein